MDAALSRTFEQPLLGSLGQKKGRQEGGMGHVQEILKRWKGGVRSGKDPDISYIRKCMKKH